jgi:hypothetical protein
MIGRRVVSRNLASHGLKLCKQLPRNERNKCLTTCEHTSGWKLAGKRPLLVGVQAQDSHAHQTGSFFGEGRVGLTKPRGMRLAGCAFVLAEND